MTPSRSLLIALMYVFNLLRASRAETGAYLELTILEPQPGSRYYPELALSLDLTAYGSNGQECDGCVNVDVMATEVCVDGGLGVACRTLGGGAVSSLGNVRVRNVSSTSGLSTINAWLQTTNTDGSISNTSNVCTTFLWESAGAAAESLRSLATSLTLRKAFEPSVPVKSLVSVHLHLAFALSQSGRYRAAREVLERMWREYGSQSARLWLLALDSGISLRKKLDIDFVEIGCSNHRTITQSLTASSVARGIAVEPVDRHLSEMLATSAISRQLDGRGERGLPSVIGVRAAVDEVAEGEIKKELMYFMASDDISKYFVSGNHDTSSEKFLNMDHLGCNSLGAPHPELNKAFEERGMTPPWRTEVVDVLNFKSLMEQYGEIPSGEQETIVESHVMAVGILKVDVEGKDLAVLRSLLDYCESNRHGSYRGLNCPLIIQFESLEGYENKEALAKLLHRLCSDRADGGTSLYHVPSQNGNFFAKTFERDIYLSRTSLTSSQIGRAGQHPSVFAWSGPLGLVLDGSVVCGGATATAGDTEKPQWKPMAIPQSIHPYNAGVLILACLQYAL